MSFGLASIARGFVPWFLGNEYQEVVEILYIFCPMIFVMGFSMCIGTHILTPGGQQNKANIAQCVAAVVNLIFNLILIPHLCAKGAAIASVLSQVSVLLIYLCIVWRYFEIKELLIALTKNMVAGMSMFFVVYQLYHYLKYSILLSIIQIIVGFFVYIISLIILKDSFAKIIVTELINAVRRERKTC